MMEETTGDYYTPESAFADAAFGKTLFGEPIRNFSYSRKLAAQAMGCMAPILPPEAREAMSRSGLYAGAASDTNIALWLCTLKNNSDLTAEDYKAGAFTPERATMQPILALEKARAWGESHKLDNLAGPEFYEAWKMFLTIMFGVDASAFEVEVQEARGGPPMEAPHSPKAPPAKPKRRTSSRTSRK